MDRALIDKDTEEGFEHHVTEDHDTWNYIYFIIHLEVKDENDLNGLESMIYEQT